MPAGFGSAGSLRVKIEATPGAAPASGFFVLPVTKFRMIPRLGNRTRSAVLGSSYASDNVAFRSPILCEGEVEFEGDYNGLDHWFYLMLGAKATTGDGVADPRTNTYTPSATPPTAHIEYIAGNIPASKAFAYQNVVVPELSISFDANGKITGRARLVAEKERSVAGAGITPTSSGLVTPTGVPIQTNLQSTIYNAGVGTDTAYCIGRGTFNFKRELAEPRACLGSAFYKAPSFKSPLSVDYELEAEWEDKELYAAFVAGTVLTGIRTRWVGGTLLSAAYALDIRVTQSDLDECGPPEWKDNGVLKQLLKGTAYGNGGSGTTAQPANIQTVNLINGAVL